jgi:hypothetical protein
MTHASPATSGSAGRPTGDATSRTERAADPSPGRAIQVKPDAVILLGEVVLSEIRHYR